MDRRSTVRLLGALATGLAVPGVAALAGCGTSSTPRSQAAKTIKMSWWGSTERHVRTQDALAAFTRHHPDIRVDTQFSGSDGYWEKLGTQATSGSLPDVIQMDYIYIAAYAAKGYVRSLDDLVPKVIDLNGFTPDVLAGGKIDNRLFGVNNGINCAALVGNLTLLQQLGLDLPDYTMTWTDFAKLVKQVGKRTPDGVYGSEYAAQNGTALEVWLRQRGKSMFTPDNKLGFAPRTSPSGSGSGTTSAATTAQPRPTCRPPRPATSRTGWSRGARRPSTSPTPTSSSPTRACSPTS